MSTSVTWQDLVAHSMYPQGVPTRTDQHNDAQVADPNAWRKDGSVPELASHLAELCGYSEADRECASVAAKILTEANGDSQGIADAFARLETPRGNESDTFFTRTAAMNAPGWMIRQVIAEWKRRKNSKPGRGTVAAALAEMRARGVTLDSDVPVGRGDA